MLFGLKNAPGVFSRIVVREFQEYIYKTMVFYFDDLTIYSLWKNHIHWMKMMLEKCQKINISINIKNCIFSTPNWYTSSTLLGHIIYKDGIQDDMEKEKVILDLKPLVNGKHIKIFLGHIGYNHKFTRHYSNITFPIDGVLKIDVEFVWSVEFNESFRILKRKLVKSPILKFLNWSNKFQVHVNASNVLVGSILTQFEDDLVSHPNGYVFLKMNKE
jgi:hypothetical protein